MEDYAWEYVDENAREAEEMRLPRVTWYNGNSKMKAAGGIVYSGGMTARRESLGEAVEILNWTIGSFEAGGKTIETLENGAPAISIVRYRRRWAKFDDGICTDWYPITEQYREGYKIQIEAAGFIKGFADPVRFDLRGHASTALLDALRDHNGKIVAVANREAPKGKSLAPYAFWLRLRPGKHEKVGKGQQSDVTKPELIIPAQGITSDYVKTLYVGKELLLRQQEFFYELDAWAKEWGTAQAKPATNGHDGGAYEVPEYAGPPRDEIEGAQQHMARKAAAGAASSAGYDPYQDAPPLGPEEEDLPF